MKLVMMKLLLYALVTLSALLSNQVRAETLSFRSDYWCPYVCEPDSSRPGYMIEILRAVFEKHGHKVEFKLSNWVRAIKDTRSNRVHGLISASQSDAPDFIYPRKSLGVMKAAYFTKKSSSWTYKGRHSLHGRRIGVINGYTYGNSIDTLVKSRHKSFIPFSGERPLEQILKMLDTGRLDAFVENPVALHFYLMEHKRDVDDLRVGGWVIGEDPYLYVGFAPTNPKSAEYAEILSGGIDSLRRSGELRRILEKYNLEDWEVNRKMAALRALDDFSSRLLQSPLDLLDMFNARSL
ncbi:transporter substrate-binding domain-containing protein [Bdellovibrio sp. 22V]|uniref:substrate-binding periplasmic protein n=1 Tax=Bdellovibrio TaxID=958 RepID=UPI0025428FA6|nr:transporter substrate-binding domain-containing protein [Bdellovibrio sp. 22V]WII71244.1 transporter substrate-binding domain-containing protein [Bdellovibrio sp. 22V]